MAEITRKVLTLSDLETNTGQLEGVPSNPRQWTLAEVDKLAKSLKETPELLTMRAPIVTPCGDKFVVLGGNMRVQALRKNKVKEVECEIIEGITPEKAKEIVIKDNGSFGAWDYDQLANEWDDLELQEWGINLPVFDTPAETEELQEPKEKDELTFTIVFPLDSYEDVRRTLEALSLLEKGKVNGLKLISALKGE